MGRKRKDSSRTVIDPKLLPTNITPPPPPDLKLQVRGNPTSGYRVCTYFAHWRPVVKETDSTPRKEGSCVATHVKTVGYIEKHKRSGKIIFVPDFYFEVPTLRYYDVYRDYDHCTYQLRADWRESWYLTERDLYQPPEESRNLKQELSRMRKLVSAQKRAAAQGIALELDLEAPQGASELSPQKNAVRGSYNQYMMGSIPTTDALQEGVYRAGDKERSGPSWTAQYALTMEEPSVAPNIVPAIAKAGKRAPARSEPPGPDAYLSLSDDPNSEWHVKPQPEVQPPSPPQERPAKSLAVPLRTTSTKYQPQALKTESWPDESKGLPSTVMPEATWPSADNASLTVPSADNELLRGGIVPNAAASVERDASQALYGGSVLDVVLHGALEPNVAGEIALSADDGAAPAAAGGTVLDVAGGNGLGVDGETVPGVDGETVAGVAGGTGLGSYGGVVRGTESGTVRGAAQPDDAGIPLSEQVGKLPHAGVRAEEAGASLRLSGAMRLGAAPASSQGKGPLSKSATKYRPKSSLQGATVVNVGTLRLQGTRKLQPDPDPDDEE